MSFWLLILIYLNLFQIWWARCRSRRPWQFRYIFSQVGSALAALAVVLTFIQVRRSGQPFFWSNACYTGLLLLLLVMFLFQWREAKPRALEEKLTPLPPPPKKRKVQTFFWQGVLILLPMVLMAGFGFWAILRDRNAVEQEAQQRAKGILQALPGEFGRITANRLTQFEGPKNGYLFYLELGIAAWPENKNRKQILGDINELQIITNNLATLHSVFPEWPKGPVLSVGFWLNTNGDFAFGRQTSLQPPTWLVAMSTEQRQAWAAFQRAACASESSSNLAGLLKAFQQTQPSPSALACAEFIQLRAGLSSLSATNAINQLFRFAGRHYDAVSDSRVPLSTLALAEALNRARDCGPTEQLWEKLQSEVSSPSALTSILLDEARRLVVKDAQLSEGVKAMRILLADKQAQSELAEAIKQTGKLNGITTTNLWVNAMGRHWFCILSPSESQNWTSISNRSVSTTETITEVQCFHQSLVVRGFANAFTDVKISLPDYFSISLDLEGEPVPLPSPWSKLGDGKPFGNILAEAQFNMSQPAGMRKRDPDSGQEKDIFFEAMPGHPQFSMQIRLTDRNLLYARQRQLQLIFGALIAVSALAALIGFVAAYRAFRRQLQLNEMKSNFVSSVSHELRAPIASVRLMAENLEGGKIPEPQKQKKYFGFIVQECRRLSALIENVLDFSRIEQGRKQYEFEPTDILALVRTTVKLMEPNAAEKGVSLKEETSLAAPERGEGGNIEMEIDGRAIQQALVNLIDNAIKHSPKGETVTVGLEFGVRSSEFGAQTTLNSQRSTLNLSVSDHGPGIPPEEHEKIFERFYRRGSELRRETQGVGIGLSIVKHIVEAHGGRVLVESAVGQGSRFTIELPMNPIETTDEHG
jgi:signal transduction histidine kinase